VAPVTGFQIRFTEVVPAAKMAPSSGELSTGTAGIALFTLNEPDKVLLAKSVVS
jgi:hypothetical protein